MSANAKNAGSTSSSASPAAALSPPSVKKVFRGQVVLVRNGHVAQTPFVDPHILAIANEGTKFASAGASAIVVDCPVGAILAYIPPFAADPTNQMTGIMMPKMRRILADVHEKWAKMKADHSLSDNQISVKFVTPRALGAGGNTPRSSELAVMAGLGLANLDDALSPTIMTYDIANHPAHLDSSLVVVKTEEARPRIYIGHIRFQ